MRTNLHSALTAVCLTVCSTSAMAEMQSLSVTVGYRERIALPPNATVDVRLAGNIGEEAAGLIASQRVALSAVPADIDLAYDTEIVSAGSQYSVRATIVAPNGQPLFSGSETLERLGERGTEIELVLTMAPHSDRGSPVVRRIQGVEWSLTEVFGDNLDSIDPPTLVIDDDLSFSIFGGCNQFSGQLDEADAGLAFPSNIAGTLRACPDDIEAIERRILAALLQVTDYVRYSDGLVMTGFGGRAVAHFVRSSD